MIPFFLTNPPEIVHEKFGCQSMKFQRKGAKTQPEVGESSSSSFLSSFSFSFLRYQFEDEDEDEDDLYYS